MVSLTQSNWIHSKLRGVRQIKVYKYLFRVMFRRRKACSGLLISTPEESSLQRIVLGSGSFVFISRLLVSKLPGSFPSCFQGLARQVTSNSSLCTSGPAAVIQVSFIPSCLEVTYLLHLPFPITTESLRWLQARSRSSRFLWQTGQAGILLIRGSAAEDTRLCLPSGSDVGNGYFLKAACFPVNSRRSLRGFFKLLVISGFGLCRCTGHVFTGQRISWKKISGYLRKAVIREGRGIWKCLRLTAEARFWQSNFLWFVEKKKIVAIEKSSISLKACKLFINELNHSIQSYVCLKLL